MKLATVTFFTFCSIASSQNLFKQSEFTDVELEKKLVSEIGNKIVERSILRTHEAIVIEYYPKKEKYLGNEFKIHEGDTLILTSIDKKGKMFNDKYPSTYQGVIIQNENYDDPKLFTHNPNLHILTRKIELKVSKTEKLILCEKCFRQQFIYNGKAGNVVKFSYKEFIDNLARPSFTQELQYDLAEGNIVGFKGLRIEVINATNIEIEYKVLKPFSD